MVEERKKTMHHFYGTRIFNEMLLVEKDEKKNPYSRLYRTSPERYHSACQSVYKATYKKYTPDIGIALEPIVNNCANPATYKPIM